MESRGLIGLPSCVWRSLSMSDIVPSEGMVANARGEGGGRLLFQSDKARKEGELRGEGRRSSSSDMRKFAPRELRKAIAK